VTGSSGGLISGGALSSGMGGGLAGATAVGAKAGAVALVSKVALPVVGAVAVSASGWVVSHRFQEQTESPPVNSVALAQPAPSQNASVETPNSMQTAEALPPMVKDLNPQKRRAAGTEQRSLSDELSLLRGARQALGAGRAKDALSLLDAYQARVKQPLLWPEYQATRALALCASGRHAEGREAAARLAQRHPKSPFIKQIQSQCGSEPQ
jgi:hypothetical protein